jgi:hypothetical protein
MIEKFTAYADGWRRGDLAAILDACAEDFVYDSPTEGRFSKDEFAAYFKATYVPQIPENGDLVTVTDIVCEEREGEVVAWCWWKDPTSEGAALASVGADGVRWQKVATYAPPA